MANIIYDELYKDEKIIGLATNDIILKNYNTKKFLIGEFLGIILLKIIGYDQIDEKLLDKDEYIYLTDFRRPIKYKLYFESPNLLSIYNYEDKLLYSYNINKNDIIFIDDNYATPYVYIFIESEKNNIYDQIYCKINNINNNDIKWYNIIDLNNINSPEKFIYNINIDKNKKQIIKLNIMGYNRKLRIRKPKYKDKDYIYQISIQKYKQYFLIYLITVDPKTNIPAFELIYNSYINNDDHNRSITIKNEYNIFKSSIIDILY